MVSSESAVIEVLRSAARIAFIPASIARRDSLRKGDVTRALPALQSPMIADEVEHALGRRPTAVEPVGGGASGSVSRVRFEDGSVLIAKCSRAADLSIEGAMLSLLAERSRIPLPRVVHALPGLLLMEELPGTPGGGAEEHAAELIAELHAVTSPDGRYGLEFDGLIGPLAQPNRRSASWVEFWRDSRLAPMCAGAAREGALQQGEVRRLERLAARLGDLIPDRPPASLMHGDIWGGNVLTRAGRVTGFLDPAPYYGHAEVELAFITLFSTFGGVFFGRYRERTGSTQAEWREFMNVRRHLYNVYPLLVHLRLFGGAYLGELRGALDAIGL